MSSTTSPSARTRAHGSAPTPPRPIPAYWHTGTEERPHLSLRRYLLLTQASDTPAPWEPAHWQHRISLYIPHDALPARALLIVNNGILHGPAAAAPDDVADDVISHIATATRTVTVSVGDVPNQPLTLDGQTRPRTGDDLFAHTWQRFLNAPWIGEVGLLQRPMVNAAIAAMDLVQAETPAWGIRDFIVTGLSKRGWTAWLTAATDPRVIALASFVADIHLQGLLQHIERAYAGRWPAALAPYLRTGILHRPLASAARELMKAIDPYARLHTAQRARLAIPRYLIGASGDEFFPPDTAQQYLGHLPGPSALRYAPNCDHTGIRRFVASSLVPFVRRLQANRPLPTATALLRREGSRLRIVTRFSEPPVSAIAWHAVNATERDFRFSEGARYLGTPLTRLRPITLELPTPRQGWHATFVEAQLADGFVVTTPVMVYPHTRYPPRLTCLT